MHFLALLLKRVLRLPSSTGPSATSHLYLEIMAFIEYRSSTDADEVAEKLSKEFGVKIKV
jgi:hypothetical protein